MSKGVAWAVLLALLTVVSVDRVYCADGCTESRPGTADSHLTSRDGPIDPEQGAPDHPHSCVLCIAGVDVPTTLPSLSPLGIVGTSLSPAASIATSVPPLLVDHPPRPSVS